MSTSWAIPLIPTPQCVLRLSMWGYTRTSFLQPVASVWQSSMDDTLFTARLLLATLLAPLWRFPSCRKHTTIARGSAVWAAWLARTSSTMLTTHRTAWVEGHVKAAATKGSCTRRAPALMGYHHAVGSQGAGGTR